MVWPFKKRKIIDFTKSNFKLPASVKTRLEKEYADLTAINKSETSNGSALGFLGDMAISGGSDINDKDFTRKLDDFEFKLDSLSRRFSAILDRIDLAEKKINRLEGK